MKDDLEYSDKLLRDLIMSSCVDVSKIDNEPPYPLVWDKDLNFIGHLCFQDDSYSFQPERSEREEGDKKGQDYDV